MADMTYPQMLATATENPGKIFARRKWTQAGKFVWVEPRGTRRAPDGNTYPVVATLYFKDFDGQIKPYWPSMDGQTEADDWYEGVSGSPAVDQAEEPVNA